MSYRTLSVPTQRTTLWGVPRPGGYGFLDELFSDDDDATAAGEGPPQVDQTAPSTFCADGSVALVKNGTTYCPQADGSIAPAATTPAPPKPATPSPAPPKPATPAPAIAPAPPASAGGLSTTTLVGGGLATVALVAGLVWIKKRGKR